MVGSETSVSGPIRWVAWTAAVVVLLLGVLYFLQTRDVLLLLLALGVAIALPIAAWVHRDARARGLPVGPWLVVVVLAPVLGLVAYLAVRELRPRV